MFVRLFLVVSLILFGLGAAGADQVSQWHQAHEQMIVDQVTGLLSIPNVAGHAPEKKVSFGAFLRQHHAP